MAPPRSAVGQWDVIFCRNVFIYFDIDQATKILRLFIETLAPGGALFLGHSEVFTEIEDELELVFWGETFYYRKRRATAKPHCVRVSPKTEVLQNPDDETRTFRYTRRSDAARSDSSRGRCSRVEDAPTEAMKRPAVRESSGPNSETRSWSRANTGDRPLELIHEAERQLRSKDSDGAARSLRTVRRLRNYRAPMDSGAHRPPRSTNP